MPPPRLPRHLRPCHPLGTAVQVRCAHEKAHAKSSTTSDDTPQSSPSDAPPERKESWWSTALSKIDLLSRSAEPATPTPSSSSSTPSEDDKECSKETVHETDRPPIHTPRPWIGEGYSDSRANKTNGATVSERDEDASTQLHKLSAQVGKPKGPLEASSKTAEALSKANPTAMKPSPVSTTSPGASTKVYHRPLDFESSNPEPQPTIRKPIPSDTSRITPKESHPPDISAPRPVFRMLDFPVISSSSRGLYKSAWVAYRRSVSRLGELARALVFEDMPPRAITPMAVLLMRRLTAIEHSATVEDDYRIREIVHKYKKDVKELAARLNVPAPPYTLFKLRGTNPSLVRNMNASNIHEAATICYQVSIKTILAAAKTVEDLQSPAIAPIAARLREQLRTISGNLDTENSKTLYPTLKSYENWETVFTENRTSPGTTKQPVLMFLLREASLFRELKRADRAVGALEADILRRRKQASTTQSSLPEVRQISGEQSSLQRVQLKKPRGVSNAMGLEAERSRLSERNRESAGEPVNEQMKRNESATSMAEVQSVGERLTRRIHAQSRSMASSDQLKTSNQHIEPDTSKAGRQIKADQIFSWSRPTKDTKSSTITKSAPKHDDFGDRSLFQELFPEAKPIPQPQRPEKRAPYSKIDLPDSTPVVRRELVDRPPTLKQQVVDSFQKKGEQITVLQLSHSSTTLTEADFRRLIPKGKHIEAWSRGGDFYKIIPGRDPLSLERMPFYYILFKNPESAHAYQKNAARLHKLSNLHQPANIFSAIPVPKGFLEDGEDVNAAVSSYNLLPTHHHMSLNVLMQPYNPALRALIERGGYQPIEPSVDEQGQRIWKVLMHIEGYEPSPSDLFKIFSRAAYVDGMSIPLRNESHASIHRLRDIINLKTSMKPIASVKPRAYGTFNHQPPTSIMYEDPAIQEMLAGADVDNGAKEVNQWVMNRVYNRWVLDFEDEDTARRFAVGWHRKVLPELSFGKGAWKDAEEVRVCNTEVLW